MDESRSHWITYGVALVSVAVALGLSRLLDPFLGDARPYLAVLGAVVVGVWRGGWRPAAFAAVMGYLGTVYLFLGPRHEAGVPTSDFAEELAAQVLDIIHSYPQFDNAHADISIAGRLPPVLANEAALTQVMSNLLGNAVKFVAPGLRPCVRIGANPDAADDGRVELWVEDNGIGIPRDLQKRLFNIFTRLHRPGLYEGTGIGLAIVKKAVERMGGSVGVDSNPGQGSRFWVQLRRPAQQ